MAKQESKGKKNINNFICFPAQAQAVSWLSSVTGLQSKRDENNCLIKFLNLFVSSPFETWPYNKFQLIGASLLALAKPIYY